jgi:hypothetical protein
LYSISKQYGEHHLRLSIGQFLRKKCPLKILLPPPRAEQGSTDKVWQTEVLDKFRYKSSNVLSFYKNAYLKRAQKGATLRRKWAFFSEELSYGKAQMVLAVLILYFTAKVAVHFSWGTEY